MEKKDLILTGCTAGKSLETVSKIILILGIISSVIVFITAAIDRNYWGDTEFSWIGFTYSLSVLLTSIALYIAGKTVARIANYTQAIYVKSLQKDTEAFDSTLAEQMSDSNNYAKDGINWIVFILTIVVIVGIVGLFAALSLL